MACVSSSCSAGRRHSLSHIARSTITPPANRTILLPCAPSRLTRDVPSVHHDMRALYAVVALDPAGSPLSLGDPSKGGPPLLSPVTLLAMTCDGLALL